MIRDIILAVFPLIYGCYVEVFGGGGWILFHKPPGSDAEVFNDFNSDLINLYRCVKEKTFAFLLELGFLPLNGRDEFKVIKKFLVKEDFTDEYMAEELELAKKYLVDLQAKEIRELLTTRASEIDVKRAAAFYKLIRYSYGSGCKSFNSQPCDIRSTFHLIWQAHRRLRNVVIENKDFEAIIHQYNKENTFFYCDPPYFQTEKQYAVEFKKTDHERLRDTLFAISGKFLLSYNDCEYIRELYRGCDIKAFSRQNNLAMRYDGGSEFPELLIANYDLNERRNSEPKQCIWNFNNEGEINKYGYYHQDFRQEGQNNNTIYLP